MQVYELRHVGLGDLLERLERLRAQLARRGTVRATQGAPAVPPACIGLITGKDSDAEKDVLRNAAAALAAGALPHHHAAMQGDRAAPRSTRAIEALDADPEVDVIIIARGGGDFQNLLVFSDENLVRAAAAA